MSKNPPIAAASATYRKAVKGIAEALDREPIHTSYPRLDFEAALDDIPEAIKKKALEWYERGIKRGMAHATDLMAERKIYIENGAVFAPQILKLKVRTKMAGGGWESREIIVDSGEIGFTKS